MKGAKVTINGGLSVLSAFGTGHGASIAVDLPMDIIIKPSKEWTPNLKDVSQIIASRYEIKDKFTIDINSRIPQGRGLKSSSAFVTGILLGLDLIYKTIGSGKRIEREAAEVSKILKLSSTGALDDICSCLYGGICLTDNSKGILMNRWEVGELDIIIIPGNNERSSYSMREFDFNPYLSRFESVEDLIIKEKYLEAMRDNGQIFMDIFGSDQQILADIDHTEPIIYGQSGKGPALFAIYGEKQKAAHAADYFRSLNLSPIISRFSNKRYQVRETDDS
ncbi:MAG: shikimate kinase [Thermoplasmataceae archaeon]